jgi:beta-phosphoglucomutase-like phosphatase (HAD superfamily)
LNLSPDETVIVEDSGGGIIAGIDSGAKVIAVPNLELMPSEDILSKANMCLESLHEIPKAMEELS